MWGGRWGGRWGGEGREVGREVGREERRMVVKENKDMGEWRRGIGEM